MKPFVSVIIPLYRDWPRLALCIKALYEQDYKRFEVIIINNCEEDSIPEGFYIPENFRIITEFKPGSYAARNAGIKKASGNLIAFTDSDCIPYPSWISNAVKTFEKDPTCSRIAGKID